MRLAHYTSSHCVQCWKFQQSPSCKLNKFKGNNYKLYIEEELWALYTVTLQWISVSSSDNFIRNISELWKTRTFLYTDSNDDGDDNNTDTKMITIPRLLWQKKQTTKHENSCIYLHLFLPSFSAIVQPLKIELINTFTYIIWGIKFLNHTYNVFE